MMSTVLYCRAFSLLLFLPSHKIKQDEQRVSVSRRVSISVTKVNGLMQFRQAMSQMCASVKLFFF